MVNNIHVVSEKSKFQFSYVNDLWSRSGMTFGQGLEMTLTFNTYLPSLTQLVVCIYQLSGHRLQKFLKSPLFSLFPIEKPKLQNLTLPVNIGSLFEQTMKDWSPLMVHTKFHGNWSIGSGEDFWRVFNIYRLTGHLGHVTHMPSTNCLSQRRFHIKLCLDSWFRSRWRLKWWTKTKDRQTPKNG